MKLAIQPQPLDTPVDWLVVFLILESLDVDVSVERMFDAVKRTVLKKSVKIYVLQDTIAHIRNEEKKIDRIDYGLKLNELRYDDETKITELKPVSLSGVNPKDGYAWREALKQIRDIYQPRASALITWSHGSGIGMLSPANGFTNAIPSLDVTSNQFNLLRRFPDPNRPFMAEKFSCTILKPTANALIVNKPASDTPCKALQDLFVSEIAEGFSNTDAGPAFDMVIMGNCNTQIFDNCYNLHKVARYYLAPITRIDPSAYNFGEFIKTINGEALNNDLENAPFKVPPGIFSKRPPVVKKSYYKLYFTNVARVFLNGYIKINRELEASTVITVIDLENIEKLQPLFDDVCMYLGMNSDITYPVMDGLLKSGTLTFSDKDFVDIVVLFDAIKNKLGDPAFNKTYDKLRKILAKKVTVEKHIGRNLNADDFNCFSIYIPVSIEERIPDVFCCQYFRGYANSRFVHETLWDNLIKDFTDWRFEQLKVNAIP